MPTTVFIDSFASSEKLYRSVLSSNSSSAALESGSRSNSCNRRCRSSYPFTITNGRLQSSLMCFPTSSRYTNVKYDVKSPQGHWKPWPSHHYQFSSMIVHLMPVLHQRRIHIIS